jgi:hypothetical protein
MGTRAAVYNVHCQATKDPWAATAGFVTYRSGAEGVGKIIHFICKLTKQAISLYPLCVPFAVVEVSYERYFFFQLYVSLKQM